MDEKSAILINSEDSRMAVRKLYFHLKGQRAKLSLTAILEKTKIPSRGYLSMVLNGKKTLGKKYLSEISSLFGLRPEQKKYFETLVQIDLSKSEKVTDQLREKLLPMKSQLEIGTRSIDSSIHDFVLFSEVFCSISLFAKAPTQNQILEFFGQGRTLQIQSVLLQLVKMGVLELDSKNQTYRQIKKKVPWLGGSDPKAVVDVLTQSFRDGLAATPRHYADKSCSFFKSGVFSVDFETYKKALQEFREKVSEFEKEVDSEEANCLVRFNIQVYPATQVLR